MRVNGVEMPLRKVDGLLVLEDDEGTQTWTMVENATVNYGDDMAFVGGEYPSLELQVTLPPGHALRMADSTDADEENVLLYSKLLVHMLREERERYAELERKFYEQGVQLRKAREESGTAARDHAEMLHAAWRDGGRRGFAQALAEDSLADLMLQNPHPEPEDEESEGCHVCGGPDH